ncbi:winged helix-turn-helix domain-containing protein [Pokkaliibacter sp. CJK22405]|uniref:winged helix-turn-helix domain-containing protein n=1 Tax=Pokkaliibacter sp. CJK22405 TaxID=3384615 RepID=UPI0039846D84
MLELSLSEARRIVLDAQRLNKQPHAKGINGTEEIVKHLGYVQIDSISRVQRAHHHIIWSRHKGYQTDHLTKLVEQKRLFEYWGHAAALLPIKSYRFAKHRMEYFRAANGHWFEKNSEVMSQVLKAIEAQGEVHTGSIDIEKTQRSDPWWGWSPTKQSLEQLFHEGYLACVRRDGMRKIYDISSRVIPQNILCERATAEETGRYMITRYLTNHGLGSKEDITFLMREFRPLLIKLLDIMVAEKTLVPINVEGKKHFIAAEVLSARTSPIKNQLHILSPFDPLLINRQRFNRLFGANYQLECYLPEPKRKYGYFSLPLLFRDQMQGRLNCFRDQKRSALVLENAFLEPGLGSSIRHSFKELLESAIGPFAVFNECQVIDWSKFHVKHY